MAIGDDIRAAMPDVEGLRIELGGQAFAEFEVPSSEALGIGFAIIILIIAFGSVLAMGLPIGVALAGIVSGSIITGLLSQVVDMPDFTSTIGIMIGLGVGIDYALFIVTRFRENLHKGHSIEQSTLIAMNTAGRAVVFAGTTVVISLLGMLVMQLGFISGMAIGMAVVVALTLLASLTLLPALLGFAGERIELTRRRGLIAAGLIAVALVGVGLGIPALIVVTLPVAVVVLLASFAVSSLRKPVLERERRAAAGDPVVPVEPGDPASPVDGRARRRRRAGRVGAADLRAAPRVLRRGQLPRGHHHPPGLRPAGRRVRARASTARSAWPPRFPPAPTRPPCKRSPTPSPPTPAWPSSATRSPTTTRRRPRRCGGSSPPPPRRTKPPPIWSTGYATTCSPPPPPAPASTSPSPAGSPSASTSPTTSSERLPYFFAAVLGLSFLLLMVVFRSLLVPLKAVIMNLLSIGAAYGIVVAVFQWGWGGGLLDIEGAPIEPFVPMMLFAIVFGLSMDYEVFLLSRVREEWDRTGDSRASVADGLASTARVITAAAAIMVVVFGSFIGESDRVVKLFGLGLAMAVLIDATIVRLLLVPATMELLGDRNWWIPRWLDRILPRVHIEAPPDLDAELAELQEDEATKVG